MSKRIQFYVNKCLAECLFYLKFAEPMNRNVYATTDTYNIYSSKNRNIFSNVFDKIGNK